MQASPEFRFADLLLTMTAIPIGDGLVLFTSDLGLLIVEMPTLSLRILCIVSDLPPRFRPGIRGVNQGTLNAECRE